MLAGSSLSAGGMNRMVSYGVMSLNGGTIAGYLVFPFLAEWLGRRQAFFLMLLGSAFSLPAVFLLPHSYATVLAILPALRMGTDPPFHGAKGGSVPIYYGWNGQLALEVNPPSTVITWPVM